MTAINGMRIILSLDNVSGSFVINGLYSGVAAGTANTISKVTIGQPTFYEYRISHSHLFGKTTKKSVIAEVASELMCDGPISVRVNV